MCPFIYHNLDLLGKYWWSILGPPVNGIKGSESSWALAWWRYIIIYEFTRTSESTDALPRHIGCMQKSIHSALIGDYGAGLSEKAGREIFISTRFTRFRSFPGGRMNELGILGLRNTLCKGKVHSIFEEE